VHPEGILGRIYVVGTADTKGEELAFLAAQIRAAGGDTQLVDVGTRTPRIPVDIAAKDIAALGAPGLLTGTDRGVAVSGMAEAFARFILTRSDIDAIIGIGGGGGTSIVTAGMRELAIGLPKLMVSTLASGDVAPYVGISDILMMPAVTDFAGLNRLSRVLLSEAAAAITAMARVPRVATGTLPAVGLTMFGVTTPAVTQIVELLGTSVEPLVFHATGIGGRTLERLVTSGLVTAMLDITTTEIADLLVGGVLPALPQRLDCLATTSIPWVGSVGACDMVNFWARDTVPATFANRLFYQHNANVTLMRTTPEENRKIGGFLARKLARATGPVTMLLPLRGVSALDIAGGAFFDPAADAALFDAIRQDCDWTGSRRLIELDCHINDAAFAAAAVEAFRDIAP
jgi:uncharacterized protein (UPF0261 family)